MSKLIEIIDKAYKNFSTNKNTTEQGNTFVKWFLKNIENDIIPEEDLEDIENLLCGRKNDCGIDAYYYNDEEKILRIYQGKYKNNSELRDLQSEEKSDSIDFVEKLSTVKSRNKWAESRKNYLDANLYTYFNECNKIIYIYITNCGEIKMKDFQDELNNVIEGSEIIDVNVYSEQSILRKLNGSVAPIMVSFVDKGKMSKFDYKTQDDKYKAHIMTMSGTDVIKLSDQEYFDENIRFGLGNSKINKNITMTVNETPELFWFYNNGITIVCTSVTENQGSYKLENPQVVNGAQTIHSIKNAIKMQREKVSVLAKILIIEKNSDILENIVKFTNSQNKIDLWQFYSNRPLWSVIRIYFLQCGDGYIDLEYKSGIKLPEQFQNLTIRHKVKFTDFILAYTAYKGFPEIAKKGQAALFKIELDNQSKFSTIFPDEILNIKDDDEIPEDDLKEYYLVMQMFLELDKKKIIENVAYELLSGNEQKSANKGLESILKHSRYYFLYILNSRIITLIEPSERLNALEAIIKNHLRDFVKVCATEIFLPAWKKKVQEMPSIISNAPRFTKNAEFKKSVDKYLKKIIIPEILDIKNSNLL
ncbi:MAG: AIPR family protein [Candidatus Parcubacteria bacterium]|nr:AIPR family protein [Candidatus Paceibacterota bacterium]